MIFYTIFTSWLTALIALLVGANFYKKLGLYNRSFSIFWFLTGLLWFFDGFRKIVNFLELRQISDFVPYIIHSLVPIHIIPVIIFISLRLTKNKNFAFLASLPFIIFSFAYIFYIIKDGLSPTLQTSYGPENYIPGSANFIFQTIFFIGLPILIFDFLDSLWRAIHNLNLKSLYYFLPLLSLLIYGLAGYFGILRKESDWQILLVRLVYLIAVLIAYIPATTKINNLIYEPRAPNSKK